jgi:hypothetical protein
MLESLVRKKVEGEEEQGGAINFKSHFPGLATDQRADQVELFI